MLVEHLMTRLPFSIKPKESVAEAAALMTEKGIRHLIVCDDDNELLGLITRSSLATALPGMGTGLTRFEYSYLTSNTLVRDVMIKEPLQATEQMAAEEAARIMNINRISSLVVMKEGKPVGIITDTDIFKVLVEISGVYEGGTQVCLQISTEPGSLSPVLMYLKDNGVRIMSVMTRNVPESVGVKDVYIRMRDMEKSEFKRLQEDMDAKFKVQFWAVDPVHRVV